MRTLKQNTENVVFFTSVPRSFYGVLKSKFVYYELIQFDLMRIL